jgi:hypothetical protein
MSRISNRWGVLLDKEPEKSPWPPDYFPKWCTEKKTAVALVREVRRLGGEAHLRDVEKKTTVPVE